MTCGILVPWPGIEPGPPVVEAQNPNHWTAREVPNKGSLTMAMNMTVSHRQGRNVSLKEGWATLACY